MTITINYVSAGCGRGKTYATANYISENLYNINHLYVAPTRILVNQTKQSLLEAGVPFEKIQVITGDTSEEVLATVINQINKHTGDYGRAILITWATYIRIPDLPNLRKFKVYIDEVPQVDRYHTFRLKDFAYLLYDNLTLHDFTKPKVKKQKNYTQTISYPEELITVPDYIGWRELMSSYSGDKGLFDFTKTKRVKVKKKQPLPQFPETYFDLRYQLTDKVALIEAQNNSNLKYITKTKSKADDVLNRNFKDLFDDVTSDNYDVFVDLQSWKNKSGDYHFISLIKPKLFKNAYLLGANIEQSMFYSWMWKFHDVKFKEATEITSRLLPDTHAELGRRLEIIYFIEGRKLSKSLLNRVGKSGIKVIDRIEELAKEEFKDHEFLYVCNNSHKTSLTESPNCTKIPVDSKGINEYKSVTKMLYLPALNRKPKHTSLLHDLGFDEEVIHDSTGLENLYQNLMRTALRDSESNETVTVMVPTSNEATFLVELFTTAKVRLIYEEVFTEHRTLTNAESVYRNKWKKEIQRIKIENRYIASSFTRFDKENIDTPFNLTTHSSVSSKSILDHSIPTFDSITKLVSHFRSASNSVQYRKEEGELYNSAWFKFDHDTKTISRTTDSFDCSTMMILDFDNGHLSIKRFERIFRRRFSFIIFNSFSRSPHQPNRFRVVIPYRHPITSLEYHYAIFNHIERILREEGYSPSSNSPSKSGLDRKACRTGVQSFYYPCTNIEYPQYHYFNAVNTKKDEFKQYGLVPHTFINLAIYQPQGREMVPVRKSIQKSTIDFHNNPIFKMPHTRRIETFKFGLLMFHHGYSLDETIKEIKHIVIRPDYPRHFLVV